MCNNVYESVERALRNIVNRFFNGDLSKLISVLQREKYSSHVWQSFKRELAEELIPCIIDMFGASTVEEIYYADLHGGEPANIESYGGKDIDLIVKVSKPTSLNVEMLEAKLERSISSILNSILGVDVKKIVGIPNIIELHVVKDVKRDKMGYTIKSVYSKAILLWKRVGG